MMMFYNHKDSDDNGYGDEDDCDDDDGGDQVRGAQKTTCKGMRGAGYALDILWRPETIESESDIF